MQKHRDGKEYDIRVYSLLWLEIRLFRATGRLERLEGLRKEASGATWKHEKSKQFSSLAHSECNSVSICLIYCDSIKNFI